MSGVYEWVDEFQFSRSKKNIARDFSDAVLLAELLAQLFPAWVELHNYPATNRFQQKLTNWETLNRKVLLRIKCEISRKQQEDLANAVPGAIELLLIQVRKQTTKNEQQKANFKTPVSPTARSTDTKPSPLNSESGLKSPQGYKVEPRTASFSMSPSDAITLEDVAKPEFADSSFVYFSCHEEPPVDDEQQAWAQNERVQVARFVRSLPSGDCLVQLLKTDATYSQDTTGALGFKVYVSTPHFIECCGSQLHNIQSMKFDAMMGKWKWSQQVNGASSSSALWKRDLAIDIAPTAFTLLPAGPKTEPALKSRSLASSEVATAKNPPQSAHFFTEVLSRVKCNSISLEEPVAVCATETRESDATPCPEFLQTLYDAISFETPVAPTVFPRVQVDVPLSVPEKKPLTSPIRRKSNADEVV